MTFRNLTNTLVNGVPIETGQTNVNIVDPSTYKTALFRLDFNMGNADNLTARVSYNDRVDNDAISNCNFGALFCGSQALKDTNVALSQTHTFSANAAQRGAGLAGQARPALPGERPHQPDRRASRASSRSAATATSPRAACSDSWQFSDTLTWLKGKHTLKFGADIRYNKLDNISAFNSKGTFVFNSLQDYMNNLAGTFDQALQTASFEATQWQTFFFVQDDFHVRPDLTLNLGLRYETSTVPLGFFGATDPQSLGRHGAGPGEEGHEQLGAARGLRLVPALGQRASRRRQDGHPRRIRNRVRRALLQPARRGRVELPARRDASIDQRPERLPEPPPRQRHGAFNPLASWTNSDENTPTPKHSSTASPSSVSSATSSSSWATRAAAATTGSTRSTSTRRGS